ncbi:hypothetical protein OOT46_15975 [Aquabacterium sp. A7-Y]|uniref:hypothetical protein n=1 Tax=Aquabacterium sp. A7-Y TaxID=1349605 RepID=UPI00223E1764|nr:hypothetical protein [Aquabacterium sp. A7-Y]MCW7539343.1 hypothetical protein [Aquabacterium sp. A7-Y]
MDVLLGKWTQCRIPIPHQDRYPFAGGEDHDAVFFEDPDRLKVEVLALEEL